MCSPLDSMVLKPVDASGGYDIHFGRLLSTTQQEDLRRRVSAKPRAWLAQEEVELSRAVCLADGGNFEARTVDLRPFILVDERPWIVPGGLTRVAADRGDAGGQLVTGRREQGHVGSESLTYAVSHDTVLRYSKPVGLSYNEVRMRPLTAVCSARCALLWSSDPVTEPASRVDYYGNVVHRVDVRTPHEQLRLRADSVVQNDPVRTSRPTAWDPETLQRDPRLDYALPSPRVPLTRRPGPCWMSGAAMIVPSKHCCMWRNAFEGTSATSPGQRQCRAVSTTSLWAEPAFVRTLRTSFSLWRDTLTGLLATSAVTWDRLTMRTASRGSHMLGPRCAEPTGAGWGSIQPTADRLGNAMCGSPSGVTTRAWRRIAASSTGTRSLRRPRSACGLRGWTPSVPRLPSKWQRCRGTSRKSNSSNSRHAVARCRWDCILTEMTSSTRMCDIMFAGLPV